MVQLDLKLRNVKINNFLSYRDAEFLDIKNYNVLIGKNNSGKSNLYRIFELIINAYKDEKFQKSFLYDKDEELEASIELTFKLSEQFREEVITTLTKGNGLSHTFIQTENREEYPKRNEWNNERILLEWFMNQNYFTDLQVIIKYLPKRNYITFYQVAICSLRIRNPFVLFKLTIDKNKNQVSTVKMESWFQNKDPLDFFLSQNKLKTYGTPGSDRFLSVFNMFKKLDANPLLNIIAEKLVNNFFEHFHFIPDRRSFSSYKPTAKSRETVLDNHGDNLVKFLHMKKVRNQDQWLSDFKLELRQYLDNIEELRQDVDTGDNTHIELRETGLNNPLNYENMGAGILNVAHFLAYTKEMGENNLLFIEEPELFLHPGLKIKLRNKFLELSKFNQIFITTHSREFLYEEEKDCSVYLIKKENNISAINKIPEENFEEIYNELDIDIDRYKLQQSFLYEEDILRQFIRKAMQVKRIEDDLWDFKETLNFWKKSSKSEKREAIIKFCNQVTSFANLSGGILIIGITDKDPKRIVGIDNLEEKIKQIKKVIRIFTEPKKDFIKSKEILMKDDSGIQRNILIIAIKQTKKPITVEQMNGEYICKKRNNTEAETVRYEEILKLKKDISRDNFDYFIHLKQFIK